MGAALYLLAALILLTTTRTVDPATALVLALALGAVATLVALARGTLALSDLIWAAVTIAIASAVVVVARSVHLTRLTPDSLRYLLAARDLVLPDAVQEFHRADLLKRQIGLPGLHALSELTDRRYIPSIGPLFGVSIFGFLSVLLWRAAKHEKSQQRIGLTIGALLFLAASNRLVYDSFYINTHIQMATYILTAVACVWWAVTEDNPWWAVVSGLALSITMLFRPEAPLLVALVLVAVAASRASWNVRVLMVSPAIVVIGLWYGGILWQNAPGGDSISLTAPVFGSLLAVVGAATLTLLGAIRRTREVASRLDQVMLLGLAGMLVLFTISDPEVLITSMEATFLNITGNGLWMGTWPALLALFPVALLVHRVDASRLWTTPIIGFGILFLILPLVREGTWRVGAGDSGNRMLAHIVAVVVVFVVFAALQPDSDVGLVPATGDEAAT